mmetsp:Transcript_46632/g.101330  ORF Transcript_46632/g.101330 Transcript_46632/m.101330 type:complete len:203 (+) Transcript_46632:32-640(+)
MGALRLLAAALLCAAGKPSAPIVKWAQGAQKLFLTVLLPDVEKPEVSLTSKSLSVKGVSRGKDYEVDLKFLRPINETASSYSTKTWAIVFDITKERKEPCWKRLTKGKKQPAFLKKDIEKMDYNTCQNMKEQWRETYFKAKMNGEDLFAKRRTQDEPAAEKDNKDPVRDEKQTRWKAMVQSYRDKAIRRPDATKKDKKGKKK